MGDFQDRITYLQSLSGKPEALRSLLFDYDDRTTAIMASGLIEDVLALGIMTRFRNTPSEPQIAELFTGSGPLSTFSARTSIAFLLGAIGQDAKHDLHIIRKIRNDFAHVIAPIDFTTEHIASRCISLKLHTKLKPEFEKQAGSGPRGRFLRSAMRVFALTIMAATVEREEQKVLRLHKEQIRKAAKTSFEGTQRLLSVKLTPSSEK